MAKKIMLVNVIEGEESRIAILDEGVLDNLFIERASESPIVGNVYKAKVVDVEQSLQAAFVNFGGARQGFLHVSDIAPIWYADQSLAKRAGRDRVDISAILKRGQEILIQVSKEGIRNKAPAVTTYISIAGRYLVLMPHIKRHGVSKKIDDEEERETLHKVLEAINPPKDMGVIIRTAAANRPRKDIHRDLNNLLRLWMGIQKQAQKSPAPALLYSESDLVVRAVRDLFSPEIEQVVVDSKDAFEKIDDFMSMSMPNSRKVVQLYEDTQPLFSKYKLEEQIERVHQSRVSLKGGGYLIVDQTEALVAVDVNSGRFKKETNAEETAYKINMQAAPEIGRQIRLRDLGGLIICDFIDMRDESHKRDVERKLWEQLKRDRARTKMLRMSRFGLIEMTRQRVRRNIEHTHKQTCPTCKGTGLIRSAESTIIEALRRIREMASQGKCKRLVVRLSQENVVKIQNERRQELVEIEREWGGHIVFEPSEDGVDSVDVKCYKH